MKSTSTARHLVLGMLAATTMWILGAAGCPVNPNTNLPPTITGTTVTGTLVQGQASTITVSATILDAAGTVTAVTANLSAVGGQTAQPLVLGQNNVWSFTGVITPPNVGQQAVIFQATDSAGLTSQSTFAVTVIGGGTTGTGPPLITNSAFVGTLTVGQAVTITVSATVVPQSAAIASVVVDLSPIGGFPGTPLVQGTNNIWSFTGVVTPSIAGTQTISITATDILGNASTANTPVVVNSPSIPSPF